MQKEQFQPTGGLLDVVNALNKLDGKWKLPILYYIFVGESCYYNELLHKISGISNTMLAKSLKELEDDGLIHRYTSKTKPVRVSYRLTKDAFGLQPIMSDLGEWEREVTSRS